MYETYNNADRVLQEVKWRPDRIDSFTTPPIALAYCLLWGLAVLAPCEVELGYQAQREWSVLY